MAELVKDQKIYLAHLGVGGGGIIIKLRCYFKKSIIRIMVIYFGRNSDVSVLGTTVNFVAYAKIDEDLYASIKCSHWHNF